MSPEESVLDWLKSLSEEDRDCVILNMIEDLLDSGIVSFDKEDSERGLYYTGCGESLKVPF